jgi:putative endonuclease
MAPSLSRGTPFVYILRLQSVGLYIGCSTDYEARLCEHQKRTGCRTAQLDPPVSVLWIETVSDFATARRREAQIKKWSRAKKEALIAGDKTKLKKPFPIQGMTLRAFSAPLVQRFFRSEDRFFPETLTWKS